MLHVEPPFVDVPGNIIPVSGEAHLWVHLWHAAPYEMIDEEPFYVPTYEGKWRTRSDTLNVEEAVITYAFENDMEWAIGVREPQPFRLLTLADPPRLVVDVLHGDLPEREQPPEGWSYWVHSQFDFLASPGSAPIVDAELGAHDDFDRFVVEFDGELLPG